MGGGGGGGVVANVNIELVDFQGEGVRTSGSAHAYDRSTCFFSEANPERQVFSCNGPFFIARATSDTSKHDKVHDSVLQCTYVQGLYMKKACADT